MSEYCIIMSYYDTKIEDVTVESYDMAVLCHGYGIAILVYDT